MELCVCLCVIAAAVYIYTAVRTFKRVRRSGYWAVTLGVLGCCVCFGAAPGYCGAALLCCSLCLNWLSLSGGGQLLPAQGRAVLITGCDSGFGHALAKRLSDMGATVFAGVLSVDGPGAQQLRERGSHNLQVLQLDVTDAAQIQRAHRHVQAQVGEAGLWGLVNNAGILHCPADAEINPIAVFKRCMDVNFLAAVQMCQVFLPLLRRSRGRIVNVTSMAGALPMVSLAAYGASKAALRLCSSVMRLELDPWGVRVATIQPSGFRTNLFGSEAMEIFREEILSGISSEAREDYGDSYISALSSSMIGVGSACTPDLRPVLDDMCDALLSLQPRAVYTPGSLAWLLPFIHRHAPTLLTDAIIMRFKFADSKPAALQ
ncbi:17-beta-hydroxysteroid dehydrogenase type 2 [Genypterus blacodes]|uniref:17-beta-hydroxysteroid dehydrogenase type 2 n=1 Tax=Genypterus blacodes TaxID=154954 RepID=UPI003F76540B